MSAGNPSITKWCEQCRDLCQVPEWHQNNRLARRPAGQYGNNLAPIPQHILRAIILRDIYRLVERYAPILFGIVAFVFLYPLIVGLAHWLPSYLILFLLHANKARNK